MEHRETLIPLAQWNRHFTWPSLGGMRRRYRFRKTLGYEEAFFKEGRHIIVRQNAFFLCVEKRGKEAL